MSASKKFTALLLFVGALSIVVVMFGLVVSSDAGSKQREFDKKRRYDATQFVTVNVEQMIVKKKFLAVFAENKCARPIQILACYSVTKPTLTHLRTCCYCGFKDYKSRSRRIILDCAKYGLVKKWVACNRASEDCIRILPNTNATLNASGQELEFVAKRMR